jgi:hypothetical protein
VFVIVADSRIAMQRITSNGISRDLNEPDAEATFGAIWNYAAPDVYPDRARHVLSDDLRALLSDLAPDGFDICGAMQTADRLGEIQQCTRREHHSGDHIAVSAHTLGTLARWPHDIDYNPHVGL